MQAVFARYRHGAKGRLGNEHRRVRAPVQPGAGQELKQLPRAAPTRKLNHEPAPHHGRPHYAHGNVLTPSTEFAVGGPCLAITPRFSISKPYGTRASLVRTVGEYRQEAHQVRRPEAGGETQVKAVAIPGMGRAATVLIQGVYGAMPRKPERGHSWAKGGLSGHLEMSC